MRKSSLSGKNSGNRIHEKKVHLILGSSWSTNIVFKKYSYCIYIHIHYMHIYSHHSLSIYIYIKLFYNWKVCEYSLSTERSKGLN